MLQTLRTLLELTSSDMDKLKMYKEAKQLLAGLPSNAYPDRELQWLVTTCWNRGAHQAKFQRFEAAVQYMRLALALLDHCHSLSARKQVGNKYKACFLARIKSHSWSSRASLMWIPSYTDTGKC